MRPKEIACNQQNSFLRDLFQLKKRVNGRAWIDSRSAEVSYDRKSDVVIASLGKTRIMCTLETEISAPRKSSRPGAGSIGFTMEMLPMAHPSVSDFDSQIEECLTLLETLYRDTYCIDFETLCIEMNQYVFDIRCQLRVLDFDGGLWDCATLAVTTALIGFQRNDVTYNGITKKLISHSAFDRPLIPLTMYYKPATITFGFINGIDDPIVDPTAEEAVLVEGYLVIGANHRDEICLMHQSGNLSVTPEMILKCSNLAISRVKELTKQMSTATSGKDSS